MQHKNLRERKDTWYVCTGSFGHTDYV